MIGRYLPRCVGLTPIILAVIALGLGLSSATQAQDVSGSQPNMMPLDEPVDLFFTFSAHSDMPEMDVFLPCTDKPDMVCRVQPKDVATRRDEELYSSAEMLHHDPANFDAVGPFEPGKPLGITVSDWFLAAGTARLWCEDRGTGRVRARFENLVPNAVYTMWVSWVANPIIPGRFAFASNPIGALDGSDSMFRTDDKGNVEFEAEHFYCFELSNEYMWNMLAVAYHSDGKVYGAWVGPSGKVAHVHLFQMLPSKEELTRDEELTQ